MEVWVIQLLLLVGLIALSSFLESSAAMRGLKGTNSFGNWLHKGIRALFLFIMMGPLCLQFPPLFILVLLYLPFFTDLSEINGGREKSSWLRSWTIWKWMKNYFPLSLKKTVDLDPSKRYIFGVHPHSILPFGSVFNLNQVDFDALYPGIDVRGLAASFCFYLPAYRDLLLSTGICDASRFSAQAILECGRSIFLVPGGATEALYADPEIDIYYLRNREGFIRLAMKTGSLLVPVIGFNECNTYTQMGANNAVLKWLRRKFQAIFGLSLPLVKNIIPKRGLIVTVVGSPLNVGHIPNPTTEQVRAQLERYIAAIQELYNQYGPEYNRPPGKRLEII